jgi:hypothetical protein
MATTVYCDDYEAITGLKKPASDTPVEVVAKVVSATADSTDAQVEVK